MNEKQIEAFVYLARNGNFARAAEMLFFDSDADDYLTPETLLYRVRTLEEELGISLYKKAPGVSTVVLTREGNLFLKEAIDLYQRFRGLRMSFSASGTPVLSFAATMLVILHRLVEPITGFAKENPGVRLDVRAEGPANIENLVRGGMVDFGLGTHSPENEDLDYMVWKRSRLIAVAATGHPLTRRKPATLEELAKYPLLLLIHDLSRRDDRAAIDMAFRRRRIAHHESILMETSNSEIICRYVEAGLGVGIVSETSLVDSQRRIEPVALDEPFGASEVGLLMRKEKPITPAMRGFFKLMSPEVEEWLRSREEGKPTPRKKRGRRDPRE